MQKKLASFFVCLCLSWAGSFVASVPCANAFAKRAIRIMPYGDSLTAGAYVINNVFYTDAGFRETLWKSLTSAGVRTEFEGSLQDGPADFPQRHHEGHSGKRIDEIAANAHAWVTAARPDVVLLLIGTNDCIQNYDLSHAVQRLASLVEQIQEDAPFAEVFVSTTIPNGTADVNARVISYNHDLTQWATFKSLVDPRLHYVDMFTAAHLRNGLDGGASDLIDGVHPTADGYNAMAAVWYQAMMSLLRK
jgi:lysophospholipase L1-like esterase